MARRHEPPLPHQAGSRETIDRAVGVLEAEGLAWAVPRRGTVVRYGATRARRPRGNIVKRNTGTDSPGYSFPSASGTEVWHHHIKPTAVVEPLNDPRLARMLGVPEGTAESSCEAGVVALKSGSVR